MMRLHTDFDTGADGELPGVFLLILCDGVHIVVDIGNLMIGMYIRIAVIHMVRNGNFFEPTRDGSAADSVQCCFAVTGKLAVQMIIYRHDIPSFSCYR